VVVVKGVLMNLDLQELDSPVDRVEVEVLIVLLEQDQEILLP
jgi:hypothetical protein